jgi:AraC-like DNA-binding protein
MKEHVVYDYHRIEQEEVVIADERSLPVTSEAYMSPNLTIGLNHSGTAHSLYDMQSVEFKKHDIAVVLPGHVISNGQSSEDYKVTLIIISKAFYEELVHRVAFRDYLKYKTTPNFQLSDEQYNKVITILNTLQLIVDSEHPKRHETLANLLDILLYALTRYRGEENLEKEESRTTHIFHSFYDLLIKNYHCQHKIDWYAQQLCLTPKYLSAIIRQITNKSAAKWIDEILILHAKRLLYTRRDLTVQQVAYELGFKENATFCRFFKDQTGLRPSEYRKGQTT